MTKTVQELIEKYIADFEIEGQEDYTNIIVEAVDNGFDYLVELRKVLKDSRINVEPFDKQLSKMLTAYKKIKELVK